MIATAGTTPFIRKAVVWYMLQNTAQHILSLMPIVKVQLETLDIVTYVWIFLMFLQGVITKKLANSLKTVFAKSK